MIFLDNASTTRVFNSAIEEMNAVYRTEYFNPSARYNASDAIRKKIISARSILADGLGVSSETLFFTSGATESNTWILQNGFKNKKGNLVVSVGEHASVYENAVFLQNKSYDVRFVPLDSSGKINEEQFLAALDENTCLVSVIHCSNETGAINDLHRLSTLAKQKNPNVLFHADGVQAFGKISTDLPFLGVDAYSISAHKIGGPKGIGALYLKKPFKIAPYIMGGGQEFGNRSGTENSAGIVGFAAAFTAFKAAYRLEQITSLRKIAIESILKENGTIFCEADGSPHILTVSFYDIKSEILQSMLADSGVLVGIGSACSGNSKNNRILKALGATQKQIEGSIRISFGVENTEETLKVALKTLHEKINEFRARTR